jgi:hydrogenase maturation protein HypF
MAMKFHRTLANVVIDLSDRYSELPVVLGGGVFQNAILVSLIVADCESKSRTCLFAGMIPPGDGGLAAGQLALAAMRNHSQ